MHSYCNFLVSGQAQQIFILGFDSAALSQLLNLYFVVILVRKGNNYGATIVETQKKGYMETVVMDASAVEHGGDCKCGSNCTCTYGNTK
ncbi:hypothetical protein QL285_092656 [Trifolium repens]|nr:hypothetical protein QL285_092656 [Trifolium repens]